MGTVKAKTITKKQAIKMFRLYRRMTKAEVKARIGRIGFPEFADWAAKKIEIENELREFLFGTADLYRLGVKWGIVEPIRKKRKHEKQRR